jgi:hypothetical protein
VKPVSGPGAATFAVSLTGVVALVPTVLAGLYGGMLADAFDRRSVALISAVVSWLSTLAIAVLSWTRTESTLSLYVLTAGTAVATTVLLAAESSITPRLLPTRLLPAAAALNGVSIGLAVTLGPALAGVLVAAVGFQWCYTIDAVLFVFAMLSLIALPPMPPLGAVERPGLKSLQGGIAFLAQAPNIRTSFFVDIVAMTFGQPRVLFPVVGGVLLGGGPITVGALSAAYAVGALVCSVFSGRLGAVRMQGRAIARAIEVYGLCILGFGVVLAASVAGEALGWTGSPGRTVLVPAIVLASLLLAGAGAADNVSAIFRSTMLQSAAPDGVRGRLQGVFVVVVTGGPRVGDLYVGVLASTGLLFLPPVVGGVLIVALVALLVRRRIRWSDGRTGTFLGYDALAPTP